MLISEKMCEKLNEQITAEFGASHKYMQMACTLDHMGLKMLSKWFVRQSGEEREHAMKIINYVLEVGASVTLDDIPKPKDKHKTVKDIVVAGLESEKTVTKMINDLVNLAESERDHATRSFLQWFVDEQVEEMSTFSDLLTMVELAKDNLLQVEARLQYQLMTREG